MPTLFRLLTTLAMLATIAYGCIWALATFVTPTQGELTIRMPPIKLETAKPSQTGNEAALTEGTVPERPVAGD